MEIVKKIKILRDELIELRRDFHMHPELGFEEERTSKIIQDYLIECGLEVKQIAKTGVVALLSGEKPGKTVLLRADMDALPIQEENQVFYKSIYPGKMHACGHDGHTAMLMVAAKILTEYRDKLHGNIKFVFQPNEEDAGAEEMIAEGVLADPPVDTAFGLHLWTPLKTGKIGVVDGPIMASSDYFKLIIKGKGGHGGAPHTAIDPVICATNIIQSLQTIQTRETDVLRPTLITFCKLTCGSYPIIIPESIELEGSLRCLHKEKEEMFTSFERIVKGICQAYRTTYEICFRKSSGLVENNPYCAEFVKMVAKNVTGENSIKRDIRMMVGEDFSEFIERVPGAFYFLGCGKGENTCFPHHHPCFNIDEDALSLGVEMHVRLALEYLK